MTETQEKVKSVAGVKETPAISLSPESYFIKKVTIKCPSMLNPLPKEVQDETIVRIGSFFAKGQRTPFRSLSKEELALVADELLGVPATAPEYPKAVETYFAEFAPRVPYDEGLNLEVPINGEGDIVFVREYMYDIMTYRHAMAHPYVAKNFEEVEAMASTGRVLAFIEDKEVARKAKVATKNVAKRAMQYYIDATSAGNENKLNYILEVMAAGLPTERGLFVPSVLEGVLNVKGLDADTKDLAVDEAVKKEPSAFVALYEDSNIETKALLNRLLRYKVFRRDGNVIMYENDAIGVDDAEAIAKLKAESFSEQLVAIKAKLKSAEKVARSI